MRRRHHRLPPKPRMETSMLAVLQQTSREATKEVRDRHGTPDRSRRTKFTPENVRQIINLVERGKSKDEIADIIGVTTGTLQVTCSKLGISLRRPRFNTGTGMVGRGRPAKKSTAPSAGANSPATPPRPSGAIHEPPTVEAPLMQDTELFNARDRTGTDGSPSMTLAINMHYKGKGKMRELPLAADMAGRMALEAEFRGLGIPELIVRLIAAVIEKDMVDVVLE